MKQLMQITINIKEIVPKGISTYGENETYKKWGGEQRWVFTDNKEVMSFLNTMYKTNFGMAIQINETAVKPVIN